MATDCEELYRSIFVPCPSNCKKLFKAESLEENQKELFHSQVLRDPKIEILEVTSVDCKKESGNCMWMIKFRHSFQIEDYVRNRLYDHLYSVLEQCKPMNLNILELGALPEAEKNRRFFHIV